MAVTSTRSGLLQRLWVSRLTLGLNPAFVATGHGQPAASLALTARCQLLPTEGRLFVVLATLTVRLATERAPTQIPYCGGVTVQGSWVGAPPALPNAETVRRLVAGEGLSALYQLARGTLRAASGTALHGPLALPAVDLSQLVPVGSAA